MYRFFEILPGMLTWATIGGMFVFSWRAPVAVAIFIILFDIYWLLKSIYLSFHLRATFKAMRANLKTDWRGELAKLEAEGKHWRDIHHLVLLPMYKEPHEVVRESILSLKRADYLKDKFIVVLATEARAGDEAAEVAKKIQEEFENDFFKFVVTVHPSDLPGEIPGKGSNETWAAQEVKRQVIDAVRIPHEKILASIFDVDSQVPAGYFSRLTYVFLTTPNASRAIYQPVPLYINNVYHAPALARVVAFSTTFWQMMQQARSERLTSLPFQVLLDVGFWQKDVVSEDSRIFWQCYLHYNGAFAVVPLLYPVSMDANVGNTLWETFGNVYRQQRRWAWGAENVAYLLEGFRKNRKIPAGRKWYWRFHLVEGYHSWATNSLMIFALGWLPILLGGRLFNDMLLAYSLPKVTRFIVSASMIGIATSAIAGIMLLPPRPAWFRARHYFLYFLQWLLIPITLIIFGAVPAIEAQTRLMLGGKWRLGFWVTPKRRIKTMEL